MSPAADDVLWTIDQAADFLNLPKATLYDWRCRGIGPPSFTIGRRVAYWRSQVLAWLGEQQAAERRYPVATGEPARPARRGARSVTKQGAAKASQRTARKGAA